MALRAVLGSARRHMLLLPATSELRRANARATDLSRRRQFSSTNPPSVEPEMARLVKEFNAEASVMLGELGDPDFDLDEGESRPRPVGSRHFDFGQDYGAEPVKTQPRRADTDEYRRVPAVSHKTTLEEGSPEFQRSLQVPTTRAPATTTTIGPMPRRMARFFRGLNVHTPHATTTKPTDDRDAESAESSPRPSHFGREVGGTRGDEAGFSGATKRVPMTNAPRAAWNAGHSARAGNPAQSSCDGRPTTALVPAVALATTMAVGSKAAGASRPASGWAINMGLS